jgi:hypothetical protein
MTNGEIVMLRTSIALAAAAFFCFAAVAEANNLIDTKERQYEGFSSSVGPLGQNFRGTAMPGYYYGYDPRGGYVHRNHRKGTAAPTK